MDARITVMDLTIRKFLYGHLKPLHDEVDQMAGAYDLSTGTGRNEFLSFLAHGFCAVETAVERAAPRLIGADVGSRMRRQHLPAIPTIKDVVLETEGEVWGGLYVLEGSRLGGKVIARQTAALAHHPFFKPDPPRHWQGFLEQLTQADERLNDRDGMLRGATSSFEAFVKSPQW
ncbi:MAG: biliverdin-producing heme oxygenase [Pseudomonadota bacterium]